MECKLVNQCFDYLRSPPDEVEFKIWLKYLPALGAMASLEWYAWHLYNDIHGIIIMIFVYSKGHRLTTVQTKFHTEPSVSALKTQY